MDERFSHERLFSREDRRTDPTVWSEKSSTGMVASAHYLATAAGVEILEKGGNAIDAAIATSFALGVCEPAGSGLGGMTMMVIHLAAQGHTLALTGPCRVPRSATPESVSRANRYRGYPAVAVPSNVATLDYALRRYGTFSPADVLAPAIRLAEQGYPITALQHSNIAKCHNVLAKSRAAQLFLDDNGQPRPVGDWLRQPVLARTLRRLADEGFEDFYRGEIARLIVQDMQQNGGFICQDDLTDIPWPQEKPPLFGRFNNASVFTIGPPGGGLVLIEMLNLFTAMNGADFDPDSPAGVILLAGIIRQARRDRRKYRLRITADGLGQADKYMDMAYAHVAADIIRVEMASKGETSHVSIMDKFGNAVAMTQSIERSFGAAVATPGLGFLYNGFMRSFKMQNKRHPYYLRPGAVARSNAAPTLVLREGKPWAAIGSTGSERMASSIFEVLVRLRNHTPFEAVLAPRLHCTPEGLVLLEQDRFTPECITMLNNNGFSIQRLDPYDFAMGGLQLVVRKDDDFIGVGEPRRDGAAAGPRIK